MQKPNLNQMWETFIKIGLPNEVSFRRIIDMIRFKLYPMISNLRQKKIINWYHFLIHNRKSGVPTTEDDDNLYFHIRFDLKRDINPKDLLPRYCVMTRKRKPIEKIAGINKSLLENEEIEEAWRIIGEQSEWIMDMLNIHKKDVEIPFEQIGQFLHYYFNMIGIGIKCPNCGHVFSF